MSYPRFPYDVMAAWPVLIILWVGQASASGGDPQADSPARTGAPGSACSATHGQSPSTAGADLPVLPPPGITVPFTSLGGHILVPVRINDSKEMSMVLDTGMSAPIVMVHGREMENSGGLEGGETVQIAGAGGSAPVTGRMIGGAVVSIGNLRLPDQTIITTDQLCGPADFSMDGVIGKSIFDRYAVEIDFARSVLTIRESADVDPMGMGSLPITLEVGIPVVQAFIDGGDGSDVPVRLVVDLGARHTLSLHPNPERRILPPSRTLPAIVGRGIQGEVAGTVGRIRRLRLGDFSFQDVVGSFTNPETGIACVGQGSKADGNLGIDILRRFHVVVDYPGGRLLLAPIPGSDRPFEYNMAGLSMEQQVDGTYFVRGVISGSPGENADIARGDRVVAIEGRVPTGNSYPGDMELFQQPETLLRVTIERDGKQSERTLELRRLI